jgi:hypothetical protein
MNHEIIAPRTPLNRQLGPRLGTHPPLAKNRSVRHRDHDDDPGRLPQALNSGPGRQSTMRISIRIAGVILILFGRVGQP